MPIEFAEIEALVQKGAHHVALTRLETYLQQAPHCADYHLLQAWVLLHQERYALAAKACQRGLRLQTDHAFGCYLYSLIQHQLLQAHHALQLAQRAVSLAPDNAIYLCRLAEAQLHSGSPRAAQRSAQQLLDQDPDHIQAHIIVAETSLHLKSYALAEKHYRKALQAQPNNINLLNNLARTLVAQHVAEEALPFIQRALHFAPDDEDLQGNLCRVLNQLLKQKRLSLQTLPTELHKLYWQHCRPTYSPWWWLSLGILLVLWLLAYFFVD